MPNFTLDPAITLTGGGGECHHSSPIPLKRLVRRFNDAVTNSRSCCDIRSPPIVVNALHYNVHERISLSLVLICLGACIVSCLLKTVVLEMAIVRLWQESGGTLGNRKAIYISPIKVGPFDRGWLRTGMFHVNPVCGNLFFGPSGNAVETLFSHGWSFESRYAVRVLRLVPMLPQGIDDVASV